MSEWTSEPSKYPDTVVLRDESGRFGECIKEHAPLILAAPDLLKAAQACVYHWTTTEAGLDESRRYAKARADLCAAVIKAVEG